jgi:hypothetical protein
VSVLEPPIDVRLTKIAADYVGQCELLHTAQKFYTLVSIEMSRAPRDRN